MEKIMNFQQQREILRLKHANQGTSPYAQQKEVCPTCKFPLEETSHGFVRGPFNPDTKKTTLIPCPTCSGGAEAKRQAKAINTLFGDAHIPFYARDWTFATYPQDADPAALAAVKQFVSLSLSGQSAKRGLYLVGEKGHCKTSLAIAALQAIIAKGHSGVFIQTIELFDLLRGSIAASRRIERGDSSFEDKYESSVGAKLLRLVKTVEWLVLDDLGVECATKYVIQQFYAILEARRSAGLYTTFTSNRDASDLERYWKSDTEGVFQDGLRIIDRLGEYCFVVPVVGRNQREHRR